VTRGETTIARDEGRRSAADSRGDFLERFMHLVLLAILLLSLGTFGAVEPHTLSFVVLAWLAAVAGLVVVHALRGGRWTTGHWALVAAIPVTAVLGPEVGVPLFAGAWAYLASSDKRWTIRFLQALVVIGVLEALLGMHQYFVDPGWIFGYQNTAYRVSGTLINRNHFAGLLEMIIPVAFALAYRTAAGRGDLARSYMYVLAGAFMGLAILFSQSRMGVITFVLTVLFLGVLLKSQRQRPRVVGVIGPTIVAFAVSAGLWIGLDALTNRFRGIVDEDGAIREVRYELFQDTLRMIGDNPLGVGIGRYEDAFRTYQTVRPDLLFDHAHNDYLETAAEWGVVPAGVFWALIVLVFYRSIRLFLKLADVERTSIILAAAGAIFAMLVHSLADFNLQIPSNAMLFAVAVGLALARIREAADAGDGSGAMANWSR
jgi:O-antigen ligase